MTYAQFRPRLWPLGGLLAGGWLLPLVASAQVAKPAPPDTAQHQLPAVQVRAARPTRYAAGSRFTTLDSLALAPYQGGTVADALLGRSAVYVKAYGPGQLASLSIRGTSARHTTVLWHGFSLNFPTLGEADMNLLPVAGLGRVEVQHGPAAALYGSGAVGGAVVLTSARPAAGTAVSGLLEAGSFGARALSLSGSQRDGRVTVRTSLLVRTAENDFLYSVPGRGRETRQRQQNAALRQLSLQQDVAVRVGKRGEATAAAWLTGADRQIQPLIGSPNDHARERDHSARVVLGYRQPHARGETAARAAWFGDQILYGSDQLRTSHSRSSVWQAQLEHTWQWRPTLSLRLGAEAQHFVARVQGYDTLAAPRPVQENRYAGFALLRFDPTPRLRLTLNARQAVLPGGQPPLTPTAGAEWQAWRTARQQLWLKGSAARSYRAPTLNERYWRPGGNPNLRPETGFGYEAGLRYEAQPTAALAADLELTGYQQLVDDWVQWTPDARGNWRPRNLRQVQTRGLEASGRLQYTAAAYRLGVAAGYAFTSAQKRRSYALDADPVGLQLPYVPRHAANLSTDHSWGRWRLMLGGTFTGYRYITASANDFLPSYLLLNGHVGREFHAGRWQLTALLQGFNLANITYQNYAYHAMPPRSGALSLRVSWH